MKQQNVCKRLFILGAGFSKAASEHDRTDELVLDAVGQLSQRTKELREGVGTLLDRARKS